MQQVILVINAGSSSIKFALYELAQLQLLARGQVAGLVGSQASSWEVAVDDGVQQSSTVDHVHDHSEAIQFILDWLGNSAEDWQLVAAGHRVVHGGSKYSAPVRVTPEILIELRQLENLAPQHQPHNLAAIDAVFQFMPELIQVACFDTAFHATQP